MKYKSIDLIARIHGLNYLTMLNNDKHRLNYPDGVSEY